MHHTFIPLLFFCLLVSCSTPTAPKKETLFTLLGPEETNINFNDTLIENLNMNVLMYEYFYNGGGVAAGDLNNDGYDDLYFSANVGGNQLYLNKGNMQFENVTAIADVGGRSGPWKTGVCFVDINGDKKLDIFALYSGKIGGAKRIPQLFINQGNDSNNIPIFRDETALYGLADSAYTTGVVFFDYDRDGDLDLLMLNHNPKRLSNLDETSIRSLLKVKSRESGTTLLQNNNGVFKDVSGSAGINNTILSYNLGGGVADINGDGWPDIYVSNDYLAPDYLYINNGDGTFTDQLAAGIGHTSLYSMGNDVADINNDGLPDIVTLDMLPEDNRRQKLLFAPENYEEFAMIKEAGFHNQFMRNMLLLNNGNGTFSEIGQLAGISNTDWSWAPLVADFDNDGWKDLYVTNGYVRDYTNMDFLKYMGDYLQNRKVMRQNLFDLVQQIPSSAVTNYMFKNNGNLTFSNTSEDWGLRMASNSNGVAYADLDNDGDLDLIVNNINAPAFIYRNESSKGTNNYLQVKLEGSGKNTMGIGAKIKIVTANISQHLEQMPSRGFQSSVSPTLHFGLGQFQLIDTLEVSWLSGKRQILTAVKTNQVLQLKEHDASPASVSNKDTETYFTQINAPFHYVHPAISFNDFKRQPLLPNPLSFSGPFVTKEDINSDGLEDLFVGGSPGTPAMIYIQQKDGSFAPQKNAAFDDSLLSEDTDAVFFDANGDGHKDVYIVAGGYHNFGAGDARLQDRLYLNDGKGNFIRAANALPEMNVSKSCARVMDINNDGYPDLFVGGRVVPGRYPETPRSFLLINDGKGNFENKIEELAEDLQHVGMVTDAAWVDLDVNGTKELVIVGEWMPVTVFSLEKDRLKNTTDRYFDKQYSGWWNTLHIGDFNKDGKPDLVIGNLGLNTQCKVSDLQPATLTYKDFDNNGSVDPILCFFIQNQSYPYVSRDELLDQMSIMRNRFTNYKSYADAGLQDIFTPSELENAGRLSANSLTTSYFESGAGQQLTLKELPLPAQFSPVFTITTLDYNNDGNDDLLFCGNINNPRLRFGNYDANYGMLFAGDGKGNFQYIPQAVSGFKIKGDIRSVVSIKDKIFFGINQQPMTVYKRGNKP